MFGSNGRFGTSFCQVSQSSVCGDKSGGGGYSHAPVGSFRPFQPSTSVRSPSTPCAIISLALAQTGELTRCEPTWRIRPLFLTASTIDRKSTRLNSSHLVISYAVFCLKK